MGSNSPSGSIGFNLGVLWNPFFWFRRAGTSSKWGLHVWTTFLWDDNMVHHFVSISTLNLRELSSFWLVNLFITTAFNTWENVFSTLVIIVVVVKHWTPIGSSPWIEDYVVKNFNLDYDYIIWPTQRWWLTQLTELLIASEVKAGSIPPQWSFTVKLLGEFFNEFQSLPACKPADSTIITRESRDMRSLLPVLR